jgi:hypothetical protein
MMIPKEFLALVNARDGFGEGLIKMPQESFKNDLQHFEAPNRENDNISEQKEQDMALFTKRANWAYAYVRKNGFPEGYAESLEVYRKAAEKTENGKFNASMVNLEDLYSLDTSINQTVWDADTSQKLPLTTRVMAGKRRWDLKDYLVQSEEWPRWSFKFQEPIFSRLKESSQFSKGVGMELGISMSFTDIIESEGGLWSPQAMLMQENAAKFGIQKSRRCFLGTSCANSYQEDGSSGSGLAITGLYNYASKQTFEAGIGADDNVQDQGDLEFTIRAALADLTKVYQPHQTWIVSSGGLASHLFYERDAYQQQLDLVRVREFMRGTGLGNLVDGWLISEQLYASAPAAAYQQMMVIALGPSLVNRVLVYPQQNLPMLNKKYEGDIQENMIYGDIIQFNKIDATNNAVPVTIAADITADGTGFIREGTRIF